MQLWMGVVPVALAAAQPALAVLGRRFGQHPSWGRYGRPALAVLEQGQVGTLISERTMQHTERRAWTGIATARQEEERKEGGRGSRGRRQTAGRRC